MLSTVTLGAVLAFAPTIEAARKFSFPTRPSGSSPPSDGIKRQAPRRRTNTATCKAFAGTYNFKASQDAHAEAVKKATDYACHSEIKDADSYLKGIYVTWQDTQQDRDAGFAYAKAVAAAKTECKSRGNAYGCAAAYGYASAWADATLTVHADAWAEAVGNCECDGHIQTVAAGADAWAEDWEVLWAEAQAEASAYSCTNKYNRHHTDSQAQTCVQDLYGVVFAKAVAKAIIAGHCVDPQYYGGDDDDEKLVAYGAYTAKALATATANLDIYEISGCVDKIDVSNPYWYYSH